MVLIFATSSYILNRKVFIPTLKLTKQFTSNRTQIFRNIKVVSSLSNDFRSNRHSGLLANITRTTQFFWVQISDAIKLSIRTGQLTILFGPILCIGVPLYFCGCLSSLKLIRWVRWSFSQAGATFIKLGQWAATRPDIFPNVLCSEFSNLHANAPCHSMDWNEKVILTAFGRSLTEVFEEFDERPIGSGTIGQVHRAKLKQKRKNLTCEVAVKITHPKIERIIHDDLLLLSFIARLVHVIIPPLKWISLPDEVKCFSQMMNEQLDMRFEAFTLHRFAQNFEGTSKAWGHLPRIKFPRPHFPWVSSRCLVEDLIIDALPIGCITNLLVDPGIQKISDASGMSKDLAVLGLRSFLQMLLWDNFVHADLHPGNILVTFVELPRQFPRSVVGEVLDSLQRRLGNLFFSAKILLNRIVTPGDLPSDPRDPIKIIKLPNETNRQFFIRQLLNPRSLSQLVLLDTGLVTELNRVDFKNFTDLFQALVLKGDGYRAGELMIDRSPMWARVNVRDREGFCRGLAEIVRPIFSHSLVRGQATSLNELRLDVVLNRLFQLARKHHVRIESAYTNLVMSLLCVEGLGRQLAPGMDLRPLLVQAALQYLIRER